jgi:hypothetical protein
LFTVEEWSLPCAIKWADLRVLQSGIMKRFFLRAKLRSVKIRYVMHSEERNACLSLFFWKKRVDDEVGTCGICTSAHEWIDQASEPNIINNVTTTADDVYTWNGKAVGRTAFLISGCRHLASDYEAAGTVELSDIHKIIDPIL